MIMFKSAIEEVKYHLDQGETLTVLGAAAELKIFTLSQKIQELRKTGYKVRSKRIDVINKYGRVVKSTEYSKEIE
jgi:hypothetical protein